MRKCADGPGTPLRRLLDFAQEEGFTVTSTCNGVHNHGSDHARSMAADLRTRDKTDAQVEAMIDAARAAHFYVRDERQRPPGQKVWSGPHVHLGVRA